MKIQKITFVFMMLLLMLIILISPSTSLGQEEEAVAPILRVSGTHQFDSGSAPVAVAPSLTLSGPVLDGAQISISDGLVSNEDRLGMSGQSGTSGTVSGVSWSYNSGRGVMTLRGSQPASVYQSVLRQVTYYNVNANNPKAQIRKIEIIVGDSTLYFAETGHFYEYVSARGISWTEARDAAASRQFYGLQGYLVTITSSAENFFIRRKLRGEAWIGATDDEEDKIWRWVTGPEAGTHFTTQNSNASGCGRGGVTQPGQYANWNSGEPSDYFGRGGTACSDVENHAHLFFSGRWNDLPGDSTRIRGYVVEYGGMAGDPELSLTGEVSVRVNVPPRSDAMLRDNKSDTGAVPSSGKHWISPDIWVRHEADGVRRNQSLNIGQTNHFYINVRNIEDLMIDELYISNPSVGLSWPNDWHKIGETAVGELAGNSEKTVLISTQVPAHLVAGHHACTLVRLVSEKDPITSNGRGVKGDNNIAQKNMHILRSCDTRDESTTVDGRYSLWIHNPSEEEAEVVDLEISRDYYHRSGLIEIDLGEALFTAWQDAGGTVDAANHTITIGSNRTSFIRGIPMDSGEEVEVFVRLKSNSNKHVSVGVSQLINGVYVGGSVFDAGCAPSSLTVIEEIVDGPDGTTIDFYKVADSPSFVLEHNASREISDLEPGVYTVAQNPRGQPDEYWALIDVTCVDDSGWPVDDITVDLDNFYASIDLLPNQNLVCTYTNARADYATSASFSGKVYLPMVAR